MLFIQTEESRCFFERRQLMRPKRLTIDALDALHEAARLESAYFDFCRDALNLLRDMADKPGARGTLSDFLLRFPAPARGKWLAMGAPDFQTAQQHQKMDDFVGRPIPVALTPISDDFFWLIKFGKHPEAMELYLLKMMTRSVLDLLTEEDSALEARVLANCQATIETVLKLLTETHFALDASVLMNCQAAMTLIEKHRRGDSSADSIGV
jgi:hypothetical protein